MKKKTKEKIIMEIHTRETTEVENVLISSRVIARREMIAIQHTTLAIKVLIHHTKTRRSAMIFKRATVAMETDVDFLMILEVTTKMKKSRSRIMNTEGKNLTNLVDIS